MNENDKKRQETLQDLARRFRDSAGNLKSVARRIDKASKTHEEMRKRIDSASRRLQECLDQDESTVPWTYLEYVEFDSAEEFKRFREMDVITDDEIEAVDWDALCDKLLTS